MNVKKSSMHCQREVFKKSKETPLKSTQRPLENGYWRVVSSSNGSRAIRILLSGVMEIVCSFDEASYHSS